jgi:iron(III) transport system substrate-binding protein
MLGKLTTMFLISFAWLVGVGSDPSCAAEKGSQETAATSAGQDWQARWDHLVEAAKREGELRIYTNSGTEPQKEMRDGFYGRYGIKVEFIVGRGNELASKLLLERSAGLFLADGIVAGSGTQIINLKPKGVQEHLDSLLVLPEVLDRKLWYGGQLPFMDKDHTCIGLVAAKNTLFIRNTELVKEGELGSFMEVLNPKWKGKVAMHDLQLPGPANTWGSFMIKDVLGSKEKFREYLQGLSKNEPFITRDMRMVVEAVARGKYAVAVGPNPENVVEFMQLGAPVAVITAAEGALITAGPGAYSVPTNAAHPNASVVFLNWILSREGAAAFARGIGMPSARADVQVANVHPSYKVDPKEKLFLEVEEGILLKDEVSAIAKEVFGSGK